MDFTIRQISILKELLKQSSYISGQYLAELLGVSSRTIRKEIREINALLSKKNLKINSMNSKGYILIKKEKKVINKLIDSKQTYHIPVTPKARMDKIISELLLNPTGLSIKDISAQLYISESTAKRDLTNVTQKLKKYHLILSKLDNNKYFLGGKEEIIREMHHKFFFVKGVTPIYNNNLNSELIETYRFVKQTTTKIINKYNLNLVGEAFQSIVTYASITLFRINNKALIKKDFKVKNEEMWKVELSKSLNIQGIEQRYLFSLIDKILKQEVSQEIVLDKSKEALIYISNMYDYTCSEDLVLAIKEAITINSFIQSNDYNIVMIKREYPQCFEMALGYIDKMNLSIKGNNLLINVAITFIIDFEKQMLFYEEKKRNVVVITQSNEIAQQFLKTKINRFFKHFNIIKFLPMHKIEDAKSLKPDFIISSSTTIDIDIPVIMIDPLFKDYDITKMRKFIRHIDHYENMNFEFENLFRENLFIKNIKAANPIDVIKVLHQQLMTNGYTDDSFLTAVLQRERMSSTAIGNYVAIPHAIQTDLTENVIAVGILDKPILWGQNKVQIVFLININITSEGKVNQIFDTFFELINSRKKVNNLINSTNYYEFINAIN